MDPAKNFSKAYLSTGYAIGDLSVILKTGNGLKLPDPATDGAFNVVWYNYTDYSDPSDDPNVEIVRVTAKSSDTLTITRAQESTIASAKNIAGKQYIMILGPTKKTIDDIKTSLASKANYSDLATYVPYTGATTNVDLGSHRLLIGNPTDDGLSQLIVKGDGTETVMAPSGVNITLNSPAGGTLIQDGTTQTITVWAYKTVGFTKIFSTSASSNIPLDSSGDYYTLDLSWTASSDAQGYILQIDDGTNFQYADIGNVISINWDETNISTYSGTPTVTPTSVDYYAGWFQGILKADSSIISDAGFVLTGGLSTQFLKADGSVDSTAYVSGTPWTGMGYLTSLTGAWLNSTAQTGLTGDKSGSFALTTTGLGTFGSGIFGNTTNGNYVKIDPTVAKISEIHGNLSFISIPQPANTFSLALGAAASNTKRFQTIGTASISAASPCVVTVANSLSAGDAVEFSSGGTLPTGLSADTPYYVISAGLSGSSFEISATSGGSPINTTGSAGSSTVKKYLPTYYALKYVTSDGETTPSTAVSIVVTGNSRVVISNIPQSLDPRVTNIKIYKDDPTYATNYYFNLVTTVAAGTTNYTDTTGDAGFSSNTDLFAGYASNSTSAQIFQDNVLKMFVGKTVTSIGTGVGKKGSLNAYFGDQTGAGGTLGTIQNSYFGSQIAPSATSNRNTASGNGALYYLTTGGAQSVFGYGAFENLTDGAWNTGIGYLVGDKIIHGTANSFLGFGAGFNDTYIGGSTNSSDVSYSTAIGAFAQSTQNYTITLGNIVPAYSPQVGLGTTAPVGHFDIWNLKDQVGFIVKGFSTQTNDLQQWKKSDNTVWGGFTGAGEMYWRATTQKIYSSATDVLDIVAPTTNINVSGNGAVNFGTGLATFGGTVKAANLQISTAPKTNSSGTVSIFYYTTTPTANTGWLPVIKSDGTTVYVPYWP